MSEGGQGQVLIQEGDETLLLDEDRNCTYEQPGWRVLCDQNGMVLWDSDSQLCIEQDELDEDLLAMQTRSVHKQAQESLVEQNQRLQTELSWAQFTHQSDVERMQEMMSQKEARNQADFRAIAAELERKKAEFAEERRLVLDKCEMALRDKQVEGDAALRANQADSNAAIRAEQIKSNEQQMALDAKWATWVNQMQVEQAKKQKDVNNDFMCHIAELQQQRVQQDAWYGELQQRLHVSESAAQSSIMYQLHSNPLVLVHHHCHRCHISCRRYSAHQCLRVCHKHRSRKGHVVSSHHTH